MVWQEVLELVQWLVIVVALVAVYRSVPMGAVRELIERSERAAQQTPTVMDDAAVAMLQALWRLYEESRDDDTAGDADAPTQS